MNTPNVEVYRHRPFSTGGRPYTPEIGRAAVEHDLRPERTSELMPKPSGAAGDPYSVAYRSVQHAVNGIQPLLTQGQREYLASRPVRVVVRDSPAGFWQRGPSGHVVIGKEFVDDPDVIAHELMHGIQEHSLGVDEDDIRHNVGILGALRESWGDVVGSLGTGASWRIPAVNRSFQPTDEADVVAYLKERPEEYRLASMLSVAASRASQKLGSNEATGRIWTRALEHMSPRDGLPGAARATILAAEEQGGHAAAQHVRDAWRSIGVRESPRKHRLPA